ncbi:16S rRNA (guanine(966)-N(2))-methyltransferase RsmD [Candidatus Mycoplasma mahonii]|uniref:16S rRNA (guanine(966)-N(2))-methyltransferase RsmD n=1 Tax=Candidatus Mycoplasma mahonii TaxID=3004105 RepID=UPI0026EDF09B|nr:16S rRNA (guanine(966)-N(2))-methyltransferase RsmD [Candidatus Mycoplasma mahonii]WKX02716.1 16S rRNA (guanine(966)-N(2))-methyltransferase RsmD [Candidatus Mycoplasma mahonii]
MLRVIAGSYKGRKLSQPDFGISRPTSDRTKEALFSMIQFEINRSIVLDLFSGSGAIAIEFASRGATKIIAIEKNNSAIEIINKNLSNMSINNVSVVKNDVTTYLPRLLGTKFDYIYMDPPYLDIKLYNKTLEDIVRLSLLKTNGIIILETSKPQLIKIPDNIAIQKTKKYGKTTILLLANNI